MSQAFRYVLQIQRQTNPGPCKLRLRENVPLCLEVNAAAYPSAFLLCPKLTSRISY